VYPGAACDIPSHLYSFSFAPNPDFSRKYSPQPEIQRYLEELAERHGIVPHVRFGQEVTAAHFDEAEHLWRLSFRDGSQVATEVVVTGVGQLNRPVIPDFPGLADFAGESMHSARYAPGADFAGKRVAVVGSGASAIQIVPELARTAAKLSVFQRTPNWMVPRGDRAYSAVERAVFRRFPRVLEAYRAALYARLDLRFFGLRDERFRKVADRLAREHLAAHVPAGRLRDQLTPDYPVGCKRILLSDDYYPALQRPNVELVTDRIARFEAGGIRSASGTLTELDAVVFATGFDSHSFLAPMKVTGRGSEGLDQAWKNGAEAYLGVAISGFPNLFMLYGPNTNLGHNSIIFMIECQVAYLIQCIERLRTRKLASLEVRRDAMQRYNAELQEALGRTVWAADCDSWYKDELGRNVNNWGSFTTAYWWRTRSPEWAAFREERA
jgi:cation diffusion facilitator CzcD-associated flavoprotein CzcO